MKMLLLILIGLIALKVWFWYLRSQEPRGIPKEQWESAGRQLQEYLSRHPEVWDMLERLARERENQPLTRKEE